LPAAATRTTASLVGVGDRLIERGRRGSKVKAHVDDVGMMLHGIVESGNDVREIAGAVRRKGFERKNLGLRGDEVNEPEVIVPWPKAA